VKNRVAQRFVCNLLNESLKNISYMAETASLFYEATSTFAGIEIS
jgi:hypothetical protein